MANTSVNITDQNIKVVGRTIKCSEKAFSHTQMAVNMKETSKITTSMDKVC